MRILIYSYNYHPEPIGIAPLMTELAEGMAKKGHKVRVITAMPNYPERKIYAPYKGKFFMAEIVNGVVVERCFIFIRPQPTLWDRLLLDGSFVINSLPQAFNGWRPDVILATVPPLPVSVPATVLGKLLRCPVVLNIQDIQHEAAVSVGLLKNKFAIEAFTRLERFACHQADKITVIAEGFRENLLNKGIPEEKIALIHNWVDVNFIRPLPKEENYFRIKNNLTGKFVVLYSGNIALTQDLPTVIKAAARLKDIPDIKFAIVGEEKAIDRVRDYCEMYDAPNVILQPFQPRKKLPEMLAAADVGLVVQKANVIAFNMPSKIPVLLASGRAIVGSVPDTGTAAQAIRKSGGGLVVPPQDPDHLADAILKLYHDRDLTETLGRKGRQHALECYGFEDTLNKYEAVFEEVVAQSKAPDRRSR